ncbi:hypothetical protein [Methylibium petroleiphilum]|nr:hypothetical protein [Methylibium petroleiphilum]
MNREIEPAPPADRVQMNVRLRRDLVQELMRLGGLEQAETGRRVTQQQLFEAAVESYVAQLRKKHGAPSKG